MLGESFSQNRVGLLAFFLYAVDFFLFFGYNKIESHFSQEVSILHILKGIWNQKYYRCPKNIQPFLSLAQDRLEKLLFCAN